MLNFSVFSDIEDMVAHRGGPAKFLDQTIPNYIRRRILKPAMFAVVVLNVIEN
ncbi:MAG: hypothetical protein ABJ327_18835 [Litoreibacter sp.]